MNKFVTGFIGGIITLLLFINLCFGYTQYKKEQCYRNIPCYELDACYKPYNQLNENFNNAFLFLSRTYTKALKNTRPK